VALELNVNNFCTFGGLFTLSGAHAEQFDKQLIKVETQAS
jgi:hypothetical protein